MSAPGLLSDFTALRKQLREGSLTLRSYIDKTLDHLEKTEPVLKAFLPETISKERLYKEADELLQRYPSPASRPPLFGILTGVKDIFNVEGMPTLAGTRLPPEAFQGEEAEIVTRLKQLGVLILGKTVTTEFAYFYPGPTTNPVNPAHTPGGSSSGSAAAVAAGLCPLALGTQTIASINRPAAFCGITGFKPSYGKIPLRGVFPFSRSADHAGFFTPDAEGMEQVCRAVLKNWKSHPDINTPLHIGVPAEEYLQQAEKEALASFRKTLQYLQTQGCIIKHYPLFKNIKRFNADHTSLISAEFAQNHEMYIHSYGRLYSRPSQSLYEQGKQQDLNNITSIREFQLSARKEIASIMYHENIDIWLTPSAAGPAPKGLSSTGNPKMSLPWTFTGVPSLTIPASTAKNGLPLGLQITAQYKGDEKILAAGKALEKMLKSS